MGDRSGGDTAVKLLLEAESFDTLGGWVTETQSMQTIGSAYIMAHGMGVPVADAETTIELAEAGVYAFWARTRDWTAVWGRGEPAGRFTLGVDGQTLDTVLGTNGSEWKWQKAGSVVLSPGKHRVSLHDLTGFNGRCDAVYITNDDDEPEQDNGKMTEFRRRIRGITVEDFPEEFDLIVAGGGIAGVCTALSAIRSGVKTLLIQDRGVLGGCNSSEVRVSLGGQPHAGNYPRLGDIVDEIAPIMGSGGTYPAEYYEDARKKMAFELSPHDQWHTELNTAVVGVEREENRITAVICRSCVTGKETRYRAKLFSDCTGDAVLARMMGAETMYGTEPRERFGESLAPDKARDEVMGQSVLWLTKDAGHPCGFPDVDFGIEINEDNCLYVKGGDWEWESGQYRNQALDAEYIRDYAMMAIFANFSYLKNHSARKEEFRNTVLDWVSPIGGKRESYRVVGDLVMTQNDIDSKIPYPDGTAAITWDIDLHYPDPKYRDIYPEPFRSCAYHRGIHAPCPIPYRCLYSRDVDNLFLGGRIISASHIAFAAIRVMRTLGQLGEVVGMAAAVAKSHSATPREVYTKYLDELIMRMRAGIARPYYHSYPTRAHDERYHIKEIGMLRVVPCEGHPDDIEKIKNDPELFARLAALGITHENGKKLNEL